MTDQLRTDFDHLRNDEEIILHPRPNNPLHKKPVKAVHVGGYFYCDGSPPQEGPDYYLGDVLKFNKGFNTE